MGDWFGFRAMPGVPPPPGSPAARNLGCLCAASENESLAEAVAHGEAFWIVDSSCPLHGIPSILPLPPEAIDRAQRGKSEGFRDDHDQDLIEWLAGKGIRPPDWSMDPSVFDQTDRKLTGEKNPFHLPGEQAISGVYLFYSRSQGKIIALYVGKAANLWSRMQTHWCRPGERGWINSFLEDADRGEFDDLVMACAWKEAERAGVEARLIKTLKPRYCRRTE